MWAIIVLFLLPYAAPTNLKAIDFGDVEPAKTLVSFSPPSATNTALENDTLEQNEISGHPVLENLIADDVQILPYNDFEEDESADRDHEDFSQYVPVGTTEDTTLVRRATTLVKRVPAFRGTMQFDCLEAPESCQNACWYQNCLRGARGSTTVVTYYDGGANSTRDKANRIQSGVTTSRGPPCRAWPFGQKLWDTYKFNPNPARSSESVLETDEWPMASFENQMFDPAEDPPQVALRCITSRNNKKGAVEWTNFRRGVGPYNTNGKWGGFRIGTGPFIRGDSFNVQFNFDSFDANNKEHQNVRRTLTYCEAPFANCQNDGRQFHMSKLAYTKVKGKDLDNEGIDIQQYHILLNITGDNQDEVTADVFRYDSGDNTTRTTLGQGGSPSMGGGDFFSIQGDLPRPLKVERGVGCGDFTFTYGDPHTDGSRWFQFNSHVKGFGRWSHTVNEKDPNSGLYCLSGAIDGQDASGAVILGTWLNCSFPGW